MSRHDEHETIEVRVRDANWRIASYSIDDRPHVSAHHSSGAASIGLYFTPDEARAWRDAFDRVLGAIPEVDA